jgi:glycosyltransferase involved in cell wall biosynthesis
MDKLFMIMPAYNEEANIHKVATEWHAILAKTGSESKLVIIDDGSKDSTYKILQELTNELKQLIPITKQNSGHGSTILYGYNYALEQGADYIFQTDSDGQTNPDEFWQFWEQRERYSAHIGCRYNRQDGFSRKIVMYVLDFILFLIFHVKVPDANMPYRLMNAEILRKYIPKVPPDFFLVNTILTAFFVKFKENIRFIPVSFAPRQGGVNSINLKRIIRIGLNAVREFRRINKNVK